jgi:hypothetical protein
MLVRSVAFLLFVLAAEAWGDIRQFDIPTLERLGNELAHRDEIAARASDAVLDTQPAARALKLRGCYTSHLQHLPIMLGARSHGPWHYWHIANGKITKFTEAEAAAVKEAEKKL